jgi:hypothetical protein
VLRGILGVEETFVQVIAPRRRRVGDVLLKVLPELVNHLGSSGVQQRVPTAVRSTSNG